MNTLHSAMMHIREKKLDIDQELINKIGDVRRTKNKMAWSTTKKNAY